MVSSFLNKVHVGSFLEPESLQGRGWKLASVTSPEGPLGACLSLSLSLSLSLPGDEVLWSVNSQQPLVPHHCSN